MSTRLAVMSDTHVPGRAESIPSWVRDRTLSVDHVVHAGDFDSPEALADVRDLATDLTAVTGNMDRGLDLPATATVELGGVTVALTHGTGPPAGYEERVIQTAQEAGAAVAVAGHTHEVLDRERAGVRALNPGSATGAPPATETTMMTATADEGTIDVTIHEQ
jgi:putative phosphoesterase